MHHAPQWSARSWRRPPVFLSSLRLAAEIFRILGRVEMREMLGRIGFEPAPMAPAKFDAFVRSETEIWRTVVKAANIQPE